jgi:hypothetical protein
MFRYLIYRTDIGNTIVRESTVSGTTGVDENELFTDFLIPEIQPLYLYRVTGGTDVVVNVESNITTYLNEINPINGDTEVRFADLTGYTATTDTRITGIESDITFLSGTTDSKIDKVGGATNGNVPIFSGNDGSLSDSGFTIEDLNIYVSGVTYQGSTLTLQRTGGLADLTTTIITSGGTTDGVVSGGTLSGSDLILGRTEGLPDVIISLSGLTSNIDAISASTDQNTADIVTISGTADQNASDIIFLSGQTDLKSNISDFNNYTGDTQPIIDAALTGASNGLSLSGRNVLLGGDLTQNTTINGAGFNKSITGLNQFNLGFSDISTITDSGTNGGLRYAADYSDNFNLRSLVDKAYVDSVASGLDIKESVRLATTTGETNIDLTGGTFGGSIDGVILDDGNRVLIKNQDTNPEQNGIYVFDDVADTFTRSEDANEDAEVTSGLFTFVDEGTDNANSGYVLSTANPITIGTSALQFTRFSAAGSFTAGVGLLLSNGEFSLDGAGISGDFLEWTGTQLNVTGLTSTVDFNAYTATTQSTLDNKVDVSLFNSYTGDTQTALDGKVDDGTFTGYTASTDTRLNGVESDINELSGSTVSNDTFTGYTASTDTRLNGVESDITFISGVTDTKLDESIFNTYTGTSSVDEIQLVHTGITEVNNITPTALTWDVAQYSGSSYNYSGGSIVTIQETGDYIISYNIAVRNGSNANKSLGANLILDNATVIDETGSATSIVQGTGNASILVLASAKVSFVAGDNLELAVFRNGNSGDVNTVENTSTLRIAKDSTLQ